MKITLRGTGGCAGTEESRTLHTSRLDPARARRVEDLPRSSGTLARARGNGGESLCADLRRHEITIEEAGRQVALAFADDGSPRFELARSPLGLPPERTSPSV